MLTCHQYDPLTFNTDHCLPGYSLYQSLSRAWNLYIWDHSHISQGQWVNTRSVSIPTPFSTNAASVVMEQYIPTWQAAHLIFLIRLILRKTPDNTWDYSFMLFCPLPINAMLSFFGYTGEVVRVKWTIELPLFWDAVNISFLCVFKNKLCHRSVWIMFRNFFKQSTSFTE